MNAMSTKPEKLAQRMKRSSKQLMIWTFGWVFSLAIVAFGPKFIWDFGSTFTLIAVTVNLIMGYKMIIANKNHLEDMDEMQRKIQFNAMAISLGVSMVFGALYGLVEAVKLFEHEPNPSNILFVMGISYGIAIFFGYRRYA
ncbi:MAG: hypothetical protein Alis3KO_31290 [Aliiglaciecola sp.]|uniref:hypothetical protein n=1 Tax=Aliiglaciecola sp. M165 TaxID=2593649 RepID=UPI001180FFC4|nr:hypothetical protein [Aliiglaciecola sp. M165]TRY33011.1 hypothetical protein FM019_03225 [Aliiglaciecola sp. M165]